MTTYEIIMACLACLALGSLVTIWAYEAWLSRVQTKAMSTIVRNDGDFYFGPAVAGTELEDAVTTARAAGLFT